MTTQTEKKHSMIQTLLWNYAFLFMLIELSDALTIAVDSVFVRELGPVALAAYGMNTPSFMLCSIFSGILAVGIRSYCSAAMSAGSSEKNKVIFSTGCVTGIVLAIIVTFGSLTFINPIVRLCGADGSDPALQTALRDVLQGWFWGIPGYFAFFILSPLVTLDGNKKCVTAASAVMLAENVVVDWLAVNVMENGMWGIGFSTGMSYVCGCLVLMTNFLRKRSAFRFSARAVDFSILPGMLRIGTPKLTRYGCKLLAPIIINNIIVSVGGSAAMAAFAMQSSIMALCGVPGNGVSESVNLFSEVYYSEKDKQSLFRMAVSALKLELLTCIPVSAVVMLFAASISGFYLEGDPLAYRYGIYALTGMSAAVLMNAVNITILGYLQGARKLLPTHLQTFSHRLLWQSLATLILSRTLGVIGVFFAIPVAELFVLMSYLCMAVFVTSRGGFLESFLLLPEGFSGREEDQFGFTVTSMEEAVNISDEIGEFCLAKGIDSRRAMFASLCAEELVTNVVDHGFKKDTKAHSCDIRVRVEDGDVVLRIRDDCRYFNLKDRYETIRAKEKDVSAHVGIRLVYKIAKDVRYVNLLDTNTLIIRV